MGLGEESCEIYADVYNSYMQWFELELGTENRICLLIWVGCRYRVTVV